MSLLTSCKAIENVRAELSVFLHLPGSEEAAGLEAGGRGGEVGGEGGGRPRQEAQEE